MSLILYKKGSDKMVYVNSALPDQTAPKGIRIRIRTFTGDTSNDIHSPGPVIWEVNY